uniref:Uncharacterized protein n=1 Tax=Bos mutus grunniens TaxID=30521 RepID=A0A8B9YD33_BOSMU
MRRRVFLSGDWLATGQAGAGLLARRTLCGRKGWGCRCQLVQVFRPEASYRALPLPAPQKADHSSRILYPRCRSLLPKMMNADMDAVDAENQVELEEKTRLINQVLELQHTLEDFYNSGYKQALWSQKDLRFVLDFGRPWLKTQY